LVLISAMNDATKELKIHTEEQVAYITLNRPERGNSLSPGMVGLLLEALENFERDRKIRVIVLRGTGKFFCSGMDLIGAASMQNDSSQFSQVADRGFVAVLALSRFGERSPSCFLSCSLLAW